MRQLRIDDGVHVRQELLTLSPEIERLHLFQVDQMVVLMLHNRRRLRSLAHLCLSVLEHRLAKEQQTLIEVFHLKS